MESKAPVKPAIRDLSNINIDWVLKSDQPLCKNGQTATANYTGKFLGDEKVFDSNTDPKYHHVEPFEFAIGQGIVIACWDYVAARMPPASRARVLCPYETAYGVAGYNNIPGGADLVFDFEMISCE